MKTTAPRFSSTEPFCWWFVVSDGMAKEPGRSDGGFYGLLP